MRYSKNYWLVAEDGKIVILDTDPHLPFKLGEEYFYWKYYLNTQLQLPWSYEVIVEEKNSIPPYAIAVRTDVYPLWWMVVLVQYKLESIATSVNHAILYKLYCLGLLHPKPGEISSWRNIDLRLWKR